MARTAVAWFERSDWDEIKRLCVDDLQDTFDEWLGFAESQVTAYLAHGFFIDKIVVTPDDIREHQSATGSKVDGKGRAQIAIAKMLEADKGKTRQ